MGRTLWGGELEEAIRDLQNTIENLYDAVGRTREEVDSLRAVDREDRRAVAEQAVVVKTELGTAAMDLIGATAKLGEIIRGAQL